MPTVEFAPLMRALSQKYTVCTVELFGYGHSDGIDTPRTNENYVGEIREALTQAGLHPPYVLMPYYASGIYAEYYAAKYPDEIEGLILLDSTPAVENVTQKFVLTEDEIAEIESILEATPPSIEEIESDEEGIAFYVQHGYTKEEVIETSITKNHAYTLIAQWIALEKNVLEVMAMPIPHEIQALILRADLAVQLEGEELVQHQKYHKEHMTRLGKHTKLVTIKGSTHSDIYYHCDYREIIISEIDKFLG